MEPPTGRIDMGATGSREGSGLLSYFLEFALCSERSVTNLCKDTVFKQGHIYKYQELGLGYIFFEGCYSTHHTQIPILYKHSIIFN